MASVNPCPRCKYEKEPRYGRISGGVHYAECLKCGFRVWGDMEDDDLVEMWNTWEEDSE